MNRKKSPAKCVTEARLVEAAAELFALHGFNATTTREIAHLANLNEVTLFRYFPRKPDLFLAALESRLCRIKLSRDLQIGFAADDDPVVVVPKIVAFVMDTLIAQPGLQQLLHFAHLELPKADKMIRDYLEPIFDALCVFFKKGADKGTLRNVEPALVALGLLGAIAARQTFQGFVDEQDPQLDSEQAVTAYVDLCLYGITSVPESTMTTPTCPDSRGSQTAG